MGPAYTGKPEDNVKEPERLPNFLFIKRFAVMLLRSDLLNNGRCSHKKF
jgi:hypothetical protein